MAQNLHENCLQIFNLVLIFHLDMVRFTMNFELLDKDIPGVRDGEEVCWLRSSSLLFWQGVGVLIFISTALRDCLVYRFSLISSNKQNFNENIQIKL